MSARKIQIILILIVCLLIASLFIMDIMGMIRPAELYASEVGTPIVIKRENDFLCSEITQIASDDNNLYILFNSYNVVQVYTLDGIYQYSIGVRAHTNGRNQIATRDNSLYISDKQSNIYIFKDGSLAQFVAQDESAEIHDTINFWADDPQYQVKGSSVWFMPEDADAYCVVQRPFWLALYQNNWSWSAKFLLVIAGAILLRWPNLRKKKSTEH